MAPSRPASRISETNASASSSRSVTKLLTRFLSFGTKACKAACRSRVGRSSSDSPPSQRQSKKTGVSALSALSTTFVSWPRPKRSIAAPNPRGLPSSSNASSSPSRMKRSPRSPRAKATMSGREAVTSRRERLKMRTSFPDRCTWIRTPSSFSSSRTSGWRWSASSTVSAVFASMGSTAVNTVSCTASSPACPARNASRATAATSSVSIVARRTDSTETLAARAIASSTSPLRAPWRSPPESRSRRNRCSSDVARPRRAPSISSRAACEPVPAGVSRMASNASSTSESTSEGSSAGAA